MRLFVDTETGYPAQPIAGSSPRSGFSLLKRAIPRAWVREIRQFRRFNNQQRGVYVKVRLAHALLGAESFRVPPPARRIVFVCFGNIMRSPMCEALFLRGTERLMAPDDRGLFRVTSAGVNATSGREAHPWAVAAARHFGVSLEKHRATQLTERIVDEAEAIIAMDYQNVVALHTRHPSARRKTFLLGAHGDEGFRGFEIGDPFFGDPEETVRCYARIERCINSLLTRLTSGARKEQAGGDQVEEHAR